MTVVKSKEMVELSSGDFLTTAQCEGCGKTTLDLLLNDPQNQEPIVLCPECREGE